MSSNPFIQVYDALWTVLENYSGFTELVRRGNRIKLVTPGEPRVKENVQDADLPELIILPSSGGQYNLNGTSTSSRYTEPYILALTTGRVSAQTLYRTRWELLRAFRSAPRNLGLPFVSGFQLGNESKNLRDAEQNRGTTGWTTVITVSVDMFLTDLDLR